jgi:uncharacterized membrane protein YkvA (DUF1232 family)
MRAERVQGLSIPTFRERASALRSKAVVVILAMKHPGTPWYAKACGILTLLYLLAPIDVIPDFIPVVGHLDDIILVPFGFWLTIKLIPKEVWSECEAEFKSSRVEKPGKDWRGLILVVGVWILMALLGMLLVRKLFQ